MSALIRFLARFALFFEFLALEIVALLFVVNLNAFQQSVFCKFNASIVASVYSVTDNISNYFSLADHNETLIDENARLKNRIAQLEANAQTDSIALPKVAAEYRVVSARVVHSTHNRLQNSIIVNRGVADGVQPNMGVVGECGVVGVVDVVTEHYAVVIPIINTNLLISSKIQKNGYLGSIHWGGLEPDVAELTDIPQHVDVQVGDTIVTSGFAAVFAENMPIAVVSQIEPEGGQMFANISVRLLTDFRRIDHVYIVDCTHRDELQQQISDLN